MCQTLMMHKKCIDILLRSRKGTSLNKNSSCESCISWTLQRCSILKTFSALYTVHSAVPYRHFNTYTWFICIYLHFYYASMLAKKHFLTKLFKLWGHWLRPQGQCSGWSSLRRWWGFALNRRIYSVSKSTSLKHYIQIHRFIFI